VKRLRIQVSEPAARELREARNWWRENRAAAPTAFVDDLRTALDLIRTQPGAGARAGNVRLSGIRRIHISRLRYDLYYRLSADRRTVVVLALWHSSRGTAPKIR
jgi:plasmid stabilization system protein ParE